MSKKQARQFAGGLGLTLVFIAMICGLLVVDMSSERYMPGMFPPIYTVDRLDAGGVSFYWLGRSYIIESRRLIEAGEFIRPWRGLIPRSIRLAGGSAIAALTFES
ncbi:MAG: hypothetical protein FWE32_11340 [Oscillospiraceae bacterium]|nr:hypothetical protein [Oscillospiraceae bacterium]